jgi:hypothetical protein
LAEVPEGEQIQVRSNAQGPQLWTKQGGLFVRDGVPVPVEFFHGYVAEGLVSRSAPDTVGNWYSYGQHDYLLLRPGPPRWRLLVFHRGTYHDDVENTQLWWDRNAPVMARSDSVPSRVVEHPESVALLVRHLVDMAQPPTPKVESVMVWVTVTGTTPSRIPSQTRGRGIEWRLEYHYMAEVPPATCACDTLDRNRVDTLLPRSLARGEWDAVATCRYDE